MWKFFTYDVRAKISPPEMIAAGADKWENQVGTGPFVFEEYVTGSHMSWVKNPDYWKTMTINGVEYQMPFVDRVVAPILPDVATQMAALQTGKIDFFTYAPLGYWDVLDGVKGLQMTDQMHGGGAIIWMRSDQPPFDDVKVRQAVRIGTDQMEFVTMAKAEGLPLDWWPSNPGNPAVYVPLEERPADIQLLYDYNPELAMEMLADAGYPEGFATRFLVTNTPTDLDIAALLKFQWAKIGIDIEIDGVDSATYVAAKYPYPTPTYDGLVSDGAPVGDPFFVATQYLYSLVGSFNYSQYSSPELNALTDTAVYETDPAERALLLKEMNLMIDRDSPAIPLQYFPNRNYWWPWAKNYNGEAAVINVGRNSSITMRIWIDQELKADMGY